MGDLSVDTALTEVGDGMWERMLSREWEIWGPNGGYMAAIALNAVRAASGRARPANMTVHFLGVANFDEPVRIAASVQRSARVATSVGVSIEQSGRPVLSAMGWAIDDGLAGLEHDEAPRPDVPTWAECPTVAERFAAAGAAQPPSFYRFWDNFEERPTSWIDDWEHRRPERPHYDNWLRFIHGGPASDPWQQAARLLLLVDLGGWPAVNRRHVEGGWIAPSIDVSCEFHRLDTADEWFLLHGDSPFGGGGLIGTSQAVWNERGDLLAHGVSHLLCRRVDPS